MAQLIGVGSCVTFFEGSFGCTVDGRTGDYRASGSAEAFHISGNLYDVRVHASASGNDIPPVINAVFVTVTDDNLDVCDIGSSGSQKDNQCTLTSFDGQFHFELDAQ